MNPTRTEFEGKLWAELQNAESRVRQLERELADAKRVIGNRTEMRWVDASPDAELPRRILEAHIDDPHTVSDPPALAQMMNGWQAERNAILRAAIAKL